MTNPAQRENTSGASPVDTLVKLLHEQQAVLTELQTISGRQQQAIMHKDQAAIEAITEEQNAQFALLQALEYDRDQSQQALIASMFPDFKSRGDAGLDFERLLQHLPPQDRRRLQDARDEARALLIVVSTQNQMNQQLLSQEIALFDLYMSVLNPDMSPEGYFDPEQGRKSSRGAAVAFDAKV